MPVRVSVTLEGLREIDDQISGLEERARDLRPAFEVISDLLELWVAAQFQTQGAKAGTPWPLLKYSTTVLRLERRGYYRLPPTAGAGPQGPILVWTGRLRGSFRQGSAEHVRVVTAEGLDWGSRDRRAGPLHRRRPIVAFQGAFQQREIAFQPLRLWLQGVEPGAIRAVMMARLGLSGAA